MKRTMTLLMFFTFCGIGLLAFPPVGDGGKVHLKVTKDENGKTSVYEKIYDNMEALKADPDLKKFDVLVEEWAQNQGEKQHFFYNNTDSAKKVIIMKKSTGGTMTSERKSDGSGIGFDLMLLKSDDDKEGKNITEEKVIMVSPEGEKEITVTEDGDGGEETVWVEENGDVMKIHKVGKKKMIMTYDSISWPEEQKMRVIAEDGKPGEKKVIVIVEDNNEGTAEAVGKENSKTITKKVWITEDGKNMELEAEDIMISTPGKETFNIEVEGMEGEPMAMGDFSGDKVMIFKGMDEEGESGQRINVNVEVKNGEKFVDINIKRENAKKHTISAIEPKDADMKKAGISTKNNLIPSEISYSPNPGNGRFSLKLSLEQKEPISIRILDSVGKEVFNESVIDFSGSITKKINLAEQANGTYVLQISQQKKTLTRKIVIE